MNVECEVPSGWINERWINQKTNDVLLDYLVHPYCFPTWVNANARQMRARTKQRSIKNEESNFRTVHLS